MNAGFSAPVRYWLAIAGLTPKSSSDGKTSQFAEAPNEYGDTVQCDSFGEVIAPTTEYAVTGTFSKSDSNNLITLGSIQDYTVGNVTKKLMPTQVVITTQAGAPPTVVVSGVEVESTAVVKRSYPVKVDLTPRSKAQDVAGAFTASDKFTSITTTFSIDPHIQTVAGVPVASDASHGACTVQATMTDGTNTGSITIATGSGFTLSAAEAVNNPDASYITRTATAYKAMIGTEHSGTNNLAMSALPPSSGDGDSGTRSLESTDGGDESGDKR